MQRRPLPWFPIVAGIPLLGMLGVLWLAALGGVLQVVLDGVAGFTGDADSRMLLRRLAVELDTDIDAVRLAVTLPLHLSLTVIGWPALTRTWSVVRWTTNQLGAALMRRRRAQQVVAAGFWGLGLLVGIALVVQPGLVPVDGSPQVRTRAANLLDGTASQEAWGMAMLTWRKLHGPSVVGRFAVATDALERRGLDGPLMARWDPLIRTHTTNTRHFAQTKAFMWVESGGRQFAVSRTGCAGLFQFCVSTAKRRPFRTIFGAGNVGACRCSGGCSVPGALRSRIEADPSVLEQGDTGFPCDPGDGRFDPERAIPAGAAFVTELAEDLDDNLLLMYIGYNSGPAVARMLHTRVGPDADLSSLRPHLAHVLGRWYGERATARASGLLDVHLPKLQRAYAHYVR